MTPINQQYGIPRFSGGKGFVPRRSKFLDDTYKVVWGPGQFSQFDHSDPAGDGSFVSYYTYQKPISWPKENTLLRVPQVCKSFPTFSGHGYYSNPPIEYAEYSNQNNVLNYINLDSIKNSGLPITPGTPGVPDSYFDTVPKNPALSFDQLVGGSGAFWFDFVRPPDDLTSDMEFFGTNVLIILFFCTSYYIPLPLGHAKSKTKALDALKWCYPKMAGLKIASYIDHAMIAEMEDFLSHTGGSVILGQAESFYAADVSDFADYGFEDRGNLDTRSCDFFGITKKEIRDYFKIDV